MKKINEDEVPAGDLDMTQYRIGSASVKEKRTTTKKKRSTFGLWKVVVKNNNDTVTLNRTPVS